MAVSGAYAGAGDGKVNGQAASHTRIYQLLFISPWEWGGGGGSYSKYLLSPNFLMMAVMMETGAAISRTARCISLSATSLPGRHEK